jgi:DNA-binding LacI/PurR family transcriptional regulator
LAFRVQTEAMQTPSPRPSLIEHVSSHIREALNRGEWKDFLPGERTLSAWLQTSRPTLRAALAQLQGEGWVAVAHGKRRRILRSKTKSSHEPSSRIIAILSPVPLQAMPPFVMVWVDVLRGLLGSAGFQLEVHAAPHCYSARPDSQLKLLRTRVPAAVWVLFRSTIALQQWFMGAGLRAVVAGSCAEGVRLPSVDIDYRATCRHAAGFLLKKGHRRIALLLPGVAGGGDLESERGFREAFPRGHPTTAVPDVIHCGEAAQEIVDRLDLSLRAQHPPTALLVARSMHALTVVTHLLRNGRRMPREIAVISRDDDEFMAHVMPPITRYSADPAKFARTLSRMVLKLATSGIGSLKPVRIVPALRHGGTA